MEGLEKVVFCRFDVRLFFRLESKQNFILLQYPEAAAFSMRLVTYVGISVSLFLLLAAFLLFVLLR